MKPPFTTLLELRKKIKESDFTFFLHLLQESSHYYDDLWRSAIFILADEKENLKLLQKDQKLRNKLIEEERKAKKYWFKNDFDSLKGFLEFFQDLNKSMFFKLSKSYEIGIQEFSCQKINDAKYLPWKDLRDYKKIRLKLYAYDKPKNEETQFFQELSSGIKNQDFDEVIHRWIESQDLDFVFD